ncbi:MAG: hypothetical protein PVI06_07130 [Desulfobacterales bacterium]|jgi:hypothetical protein
MLVLQNRHRQGHTVKPAVASALIFEFWGLPPLCLRLGVTTLSENCPCYLPPQQQLF